ncbi:MAG TPA: amidohydrolase [Polyangia bacterium]|nr:amidohydrolase [Polyangia bacterium]
MRALALVSLVAAVTPAAVAAEPLPPADLVLRGGDVLTQDPARPHARAVAVRGHVIVALDDVDSLIGPKTRVVELHGRAVVPSVTDAHAHLVGLGLAAQQIDLHGCRSADACADAVALGLRDPHRSPKRGDWILGRGWDQNRFPDGKFPTHATLDRFAGAVFLERVDGHAIWVNGKAMQLAHVDRATKDPPGGRILRDGNGDPTGIFVDNAMALVERALPAPTAAETEAAILRGQDLALAAGLTEIHEMGIGHDVVDVYRRLAADGKLKLRVYAFAAQSDADRVLAHAPAPSQRDAMFTLRGIKLYADGALGSRGAALLQPYSDEPASTGLVITPEPELARIARAAVAKGWQVGVHAIGDRGNRNVLDAYAAAGVRPAQRFRIEHAQVVALDDIPRFAKMGIIASMQPTHATSDSPWAEKRVGPERIKGAYAWRRMLLAGVPLAFGSDFPVELPLVVDGIRAGVERGGWTVDQKLTLDETLRAFTTGAAFAAFEESWRGRAAPGMAADFTIFDGPARSLGHGKIDMTIVGGRVVYERR